MFMSIVAVLAAAAMQTEQSVAADPKQVTCIAPRDKSGHQMPHKICKTYAQWTRYVQRETARTQLRQMVEHDRTYPDVSRTGVFYGDIYGVRLSRPTLGMGVYGRTLP